MSQIRIFRVGFKTQDTQKFNHIFLFEESSAKTQPSVNAWYWRQAKQSKQKCLWLQRRDFPIKSGIPVCFLASCSDKECWTQFFCKYSGCLWSLIHGFILFFFINQAMIIPKWRLECAKHFHYKSLLNCRILLKSLWQNEEHWMNLRVTKIINKVLVQIPDHWQWCEFIQSINIPLIQRVQRWELFC